MSEEDTRAACEVCGCRTELPVTIDDKLHCPVCLLQRAPGEGDKLQSYYIEQEGKIHEQYEQELTAAHDNFRKRLEKLLNEVANIITEGTGNDPRA